jgi:hypothetical protein
MTPARGLNLLGTRPSSTPRFDAAHGRLFNLRQQPFDLLRPTTSSHLPPPWNGGGCTSILPSGTRDMPPKTANCLPKSAILRPKASLGSAPFRGCCATPEPVYSATAFLIADRPPQEARRLIYAMPSPSFLTFFLHSKKFSSIVLVRVSYLPSLSLSSLRRLVRSSYYDKALDA